MTLDVARPTCPNCHGAAVVATRMRNAPEVEVLTCATCSLSWSALGCDARTCPRRAVVMCGQCHRPKCGNHGFHGKTAIKQGICDACVRRTANVAKRPKRETRWSRVANRD